MSVDPLKKVVYKEIDFDPFSNDQEIYVPTTEPQREIWTNIQFGGVEANLAYNESVTLTLDGPFEVSVFRKAVAELLNRHDALRSTFTADGMSFVISPVTSINVPFYDFSAFDAITLNQKYADYIAAETNFVFDLENGPLAKFTVIKTAEHQHRVILTFHHIVCDGWSLGIIMQDLGKFYSAHKSGVPPIFEPAVSFKQFAFEEQQYSGSSENKEVENFWVNQYKTGIPVMEMPLDKLRPALRTYAAKRIDLVVEPALVERIRKTGAKQSCSFVTTLVTAFEVFLHRITGHEEIVVGLPAAGQSLGGKDNLVGHVVNLLPLKSSIVPSGTFNQYLRKRKPEILDAYDHQKYTFGSLINQLNIPRDPSRIPLVPVAFNVDIGITNGVFFHGCDYSFTTNPRSHENFEIFINAAGSGNNLTLECTHNTDLFDSTVMKVRMEEFVVLLESITDNPDEKISHLGLLTITEKNKLLIDWNTTYLEYDQTVCIHHVFEKAVSLYGNSPAIWHQGTEISFSELNERANRLAHFLIEKGAGPEILIGICMDRTIDMVIAMYAVLKSGSAYVPIDPFYPVDRIAFILGDAKATIVITDLASMHLVPAFSTGIICIEQIDFENNSYSILDPVTAVKSNNQAYNIYTSGSTGHPKGVTIEHKSVNALTAWAATVFTREQLNGVLGSTTICFDLSVFEIFVTLCLGGRLVLVKDALELPDVDEGAAISLINTVPSAMTELMKMDNAVTASIRTVILCGEPLPTRLVNSIYKNTSVNKVYDLYGPTEDTVYATCMLRVRDEPATIGKIISNSVIYILDKNLQPVPIGLPGEMYLGGDGLARGYLYRPELTAEKFISNPFSNNPSSRLYKTGDIAKFRQDGNIEFLGRIDSQVKIRGYRIELGEIESLLAKHPSIREQIVIAREDEPGDKRLVAYLVSMSGEKVEVSELREYLKKYLPEYMLPSLFVFLEAMPQTPNNKIDRKALPKLEGGMLKTENNFEVPDSPVEELLADIWRTILDVDRVGRKDNFFELGGHSLLAVRMFNEVEKQTGIKVQLPVIFRAPNIEELAGFINKEESTKPWSCLVPLQSKGNRPPLFCIHMHNGNINRWRVLTKHLGNDQPIYAVQPRGLDVKQEPHRTIEGMAKYYLNIIKSVQSKGPYRLLGLCFSGMVVFEMAALLEKEGEKVAFLGMVNNYAPPENPTLYRIQSGLDKFMKLEISEKINYAVGKNLLMGKNLFHVAKKWIGTSQIVEEAQVEEESKEVGHDLRSIHSTALLNYHPTHIYGGDIAIIRTNEPIENYFNEFLGWDRLITGKIETTIIDGSDNDTIITDEPFNTILSLKVKEYLDKTENHGP